jgi:hypothetical protein
LFNEFV